MLIFIMILAALGQLVAFEPFSEPKLMIFTDQIKLALVDSVLWSFESSWTPIHQHVLDVQHYKSKIVAVTDSHLLLLKGNVWTNISRPCENIHLRLKDDIVVKCADKSFIYLDEWKAFEGDCVSQTFCLVQGKVGSFENILQIGSAYGWDFAVNSQNELLIAPQGKPLVKSDIPPSTSFTILESTSNFVMIDVLKDDESTLYYSRDGVKFLKSLEHTNRLLVGFVDAEKVGEKWIANVKPLKTLLSKDGVEWSPLANNLNLHSVTSFTNKGKVFGVPSAPNVFMGIGSLETLKPYPECDAYLSLDAGETWKMVGQGPHKFEILNNGSLIVMIPDKSTNYFTFSKDQGQTWNNFSFGKEIKPLWTIADEQGSGSSLFVFTGQEVVSINFANHVDEALVISNALYMKRGSDVYKYDGLKEELFQSDIVKMMANGNDLITMSSLDIFVNGKKFKLPQPFSTLGNVIDFHPTEPNWYVVLTGARGCPDVKQCFTTAYYTKDAGETFTEIDTWANKCVWVWDVGFMNSAIPKDAIYCTVYPNKDSSVGQDRLMFSETLLKLKMYPEKRDLIDAFDFYVVSGYLLTSNTTLSSSSNGLDFYPVKFPLTQPSNAFTVLNGNSSVFCFIRTKNNYGTLYKSNQNGLYFSPSLANVRHLDYVEFQQMSVPGTLLVNQFSPFDNTVETLISFDDGLGWDHLRVGNSQLHLHYGKNSIAPGLFIGVGNLGNTLLAYNLGDVYLSRDGGYQWKRITTDAHQWSFNAGILLLVNDEEPTNKVLYSLDDGKQMNELIFTTAPVRIEKILNFKDFFVLIGSNNQLYKIVISREKCQQSALQEVETACFLGKKSTFYRRQFNCSIDVPEPKVELGCECSLSDFECPDESYRTEIGVCTGESNFIRKEYSRCKGGLDMTNKNPKQVDLTVFPFDGVVQDFIYFGPRVFFKVDSKLFYFENKQLNLLPDVDSFYNDTIHQRLFLLGKGLSVSVDGLVFKPLKFSEQGKFHLQVHSKDASKLLMTGSSTFYSKDFGETWQSLGDLSECQFALESILCLKNGKLGLYINDYQSLFDSTGFAVLDKYAVAISGDNAMISTNGIEWSPASLGDKNISASGFTVLDSGLDALFLHVTKDNDKGMIVKGINHQFTMLVDDVHQNKRGYVDFERTRDGILFVNQIKDNKIVTLSSWDDGATWNPIMTEKGLLHLHAYSERRDPRDLYSSSSAYGLLVANGNIGEKLDDDATSQMFMSRDAGKTWTKISEKGDSMVEIGDHGNIILLVTEVESTHQLDYSIDAGRTFQTLELMDRMNTTQFRVDNIITTNGDSSSFFVLGKVHGGNTIAIQLDFSRLWSRQCTLQDFEAWQMDKCMYGKQTTFYRRKENADCFIGDFQVPEYSRSCHCTNEDYHLIGSLRVKKEYSECSNYSVNYYWTLLLFIIIPIILFVMGYMSLDTKYQNYTRLSLPTDDLNFVQRNTSKVLDYWHSITDKISTWISQRRGYQPVNPFEDLEEEEI